MSSQHSEPGGARPARYQADPGSDIAILRRVLGGPGCDDLSSKASDAADFALDRLGSLVARVSEEKRELLEQLEAAEQALMVASIEVAGEEPGIDKAQAIFDEWLRLGKHRPLPPLEASSPASGSEVDWPMTRIDALDSNQESGSD